MTILTSKQAEQLSDALVAAFNPGTLAWVVRTSLGPQLYEIVNTQQGLVQVVAELLAWVERRGPGALEALVRGAISAQPNHPLLRAFCEQHFSKALQTLDARALVKSFSLGLQLLIDMKDIPAVRQTVGGFRADLEATSRQIHVLKQYKVLHDSLHGLQLSLGAIGDVVGRSATDSNVLLNLGRISIPLMRYAKDARASSVTLPSRAIEDDWIDDFEACIRDINSNPPDRATVVEAVERLRRLLTQAARINALLVSAANNLRLESFVETMKVISDSLRGAPQQDRVLKLFESSTSVGLLRARIDGLVSEHNEWQLFTGRLDLAETNQWHQPQARVPKWPQFQSKMTALLAAYPETDWSRDLSQRLAKWIAATPSAVPDQREKIAGEVAFEELHVACIYRFYDVDKELNELSGRVTEVTQPVDTLLAAIQ
jgi:Effector-associated domain 1